MSGKNVDQAQHVETKQLRQELLHRQKCCQKTEARQPIQTCSADKLMQTFARLKSASVKTNPVPPHRSKQPTYTQKDKSKFYRHTLHLAGSPGEVSLYTAPQAVKPAAESSKKGLKV
eukprot:s2661_g5.t1